jgi:alanine racemase
MTLRLTVDEARWRDHVVRSVTEAGSPTAVVKGNGYGFGRQRLAVEAAKHTRRLAVGTIHELDVVPLLVRAAAAGTIPALPQVEVLSPLVHPPADPMAVVPGDVILTIGAEAHVHALATIGWQGRVHLKLESAMHRFGVAPDALDGLADAAERAGLEPVGYVLHSPLPGPSRSELETVAEVERWLAHLDPTLPITVSHLMPGSVQRLRERLAPQPIELRLGTHLWHGDKSFLHLEADVLDVRTLPPNSVAGYRLTRVVDGGIVAMIGAGSAHGVQPLDDGRSPFHFRRQRLALVEPPHMHTSMVLVGRGQQPPTTGDWVDVQRPLIATEADELVWV